MFKVLQARLQQYMNHEIPDVQDGFNKGRGTKIQISNMCGLIKIKRELQKKKKSTSYSLFISLSRWCYPTTHPLSSFSLPALNLSSIGIFSTESLLCIRWPKYLSFSFNISSSNERPGLISFRMNWLNPLAVQRTLKSLLQHHSSKASILGAQLSL